MLLFVAGPPPARKTPLLRTADGEWVRRFDLVEFAVDKFKSSDFAWPDAEFALVKERCRALARGRRSLAAIIDQIYCHSAHLAQKAGARWGDKTPYNALHLEKLEGLFPRAQYVHIVRDPRAVALSHVKAAERSPKIVTRDFRSAAERWNVSVAQARRLKGRFPKRVFEVRYEDLLSATEDWLRKICSFAGLSFSAEMLSFYESAASLGDVAAFAHHAKVRGPLDRNRSEAWRTDMPSDAVALVTDLTRKQRPLFGYDG